MSGPHDPCIPRLRSPWPDRRGPGRGLTFGFEALTVYAFLPSNVLIQWGSFSSSCWLSCVTCTLCGVCQWFRLSGPRPLTLARIWGQLGFQCLCSSPLRLPQASICRADVSQVGASPLGLRPLQQIFLSGGFSRNHGTLAGFGVQARFLGGSAPPNPHC